VVKLGFWLPEWHPLYAQLDNINGSIFPWKQAVVSGLLASIIGASESCLHELITTIIIAAMIINNDKIFSVSNALDFLLQNKENSPMYADWVAIAAGKGDNSDLKSYISNYLKSNPINSNIITDYERRAMALMALGVNPYNGTNVNYIKKIIDSLKLQ